MRIMEAWNILRNHQGITLEQLAETINRYQDKYPQPGEKPMTAKELSRIFCSDSEPRLRTYNLILMALNLRHDDPRYL